MTDPTDPSDGTIHISFDGDAATPAPDSTEPRMNDDSAPANSSAAESEQINALKEQLLRKAAEFENFRRRTREEQSMLVKYGNEGLILELLPALDDLDRSLKSGREHTDFDAFYKGAELVRNKLVKILEARGLKTIACVGTPFDENLHDALLQVPRADMAPGTVIDEVETGYMLYDRVIRHAKVTVAAESA
jgi:molecular chaperone GrpE